MSQIAISGNATGAAIFTIASPATGTNRTLNLPDVDGTVVTSDASGNVGIGTSSPAVNLDVVGTSGLRVKYGAGSGLLVNQLSSGGSAYINNQANAALVFATNNAEAMRIDSSGNLLVGTTSTTPRDFASGSGGTKIPLAGGTFEFATSDVNGYFINSITTGSSTLINFRQKGVGIGSVTYNGSSIAYNTSSDYRLKDNISPMMGALAKVTQLKPCTYKWKADGSDGQGFIAHELEEVVQGCVTGEKDAVDDIGKPKYQGIDTSFLVATLTSAIQELKVLVDAQADRITVLEAR